VIFFFPWLIFQQFCLLRPLFLSLIFFLKEGKQTSFADVLWAVHYSLTALLVGSYSCTVLIYLSENRERKRQVSLCLLGGDVVWEEKTQPRTALFLFAPAKLGWTL